MYIVTVVDLYASGAARASLTYHIEKSKITIGRDNSNDIVLRQTDVSTKHASIKVTKKGIVLTDLKSTNGTKVNQERLHGSIIVSSKDEIQMGGAILRLSGHALLERASNSGSSGDLDRSVLDPDDDDDIASPPSSTPGLRQDRSDSFGQDARQRENYNPNPDHEVRDPYSYSSGRNGATGGPSPLSLLVPAEERSDPFKVAPSLPREPSASMAFPSMSGLEKDDRANSGNSSISDIISDLEARTRGKEPAKRAIQKPTPVAVPIQPPLRRIFEPGNRQLGSENALVSATFWTVGTGKAHGQTRQFATHSITIGRSPSNSLSLPCPKASTHHARLEYQNQRLILEDLQSTNGTKINGTALHGRAEVTENDVVSIGSFECFFSFQIMESREPPRTMDVSGTSQPSTAASNDTRRARTPHVEAAAGRFPSLAESSPAALREGPSRPAPAPLEDQRPPAQLEGIRSSRAQVTPAATPQASRMLQLGASQTPHTPIHTQERSGVRLEQAAPRARKPSSRERVTLVRQELGAILDQVQDLGVHEEENRHLCVCIAAALRHLFPILADKADQEDIEKLCENALISVREALVISLGAGPLTQYANGLTTALAWLFPLSAIAARNPDGPKDVAFPHATESSPEVGARSPADEVNEKGLMARYVARADFSSLEGIGEVVSSVARSLLFDETQVPNLRCAVEEACANVVLHAFDYPGQGYFEVSFFTSRDRELLIVVDDRGLPYDFAKLESGATAGLGVTVMRALCPSVRFMARGRNGKRVQMSFELPPRHTGVFSGPKLDTDKVFGVSGASRYEVVQLKRDAAVEIAKCAYRSEGYGHLDERIYDVALQEQRLADGTQLSVLAVSEEGHGVGHLAVVSPRPGSRIGQVEELAIVPQLRGSHMMSRLAQGLMDGARQTGMEGLYIATPATQKYQRIAVRALGAIPMGYCVVPVLGETGAPVAGRVTPGPVVTLVSYLPLAQGQEREVFLPPHHAEMLIWSYRELGMDRLCKEPPVGHTSAAPALSVVKRDDHEIPLSTVFKIATIGEDLLDVLASHLQECSGKPTPGVFVDLPLELPETTAVCEPVEQLGFVFSCLLPNTDHGDVLRLQRTPSSPVSFGAVEVEGPYETSLKHYVDSWHNAG